MDMIIGTTGGTIGETSVIAIVLGACILIVTGIIDLKVPGSYLLSFAGFVALFTLLTGRDVSWAYVSAQLAGGGLMLGAFFMATDYVTRPVTKKGQYIYGIFLGFLTAVFRVSEPAQREYPMRYFSATCLFLLSSGLPCLKHSAKEASDHEKYVEGRGDFICQSHWSPVCC